jgi:hypothetical protein
VQVMGSPARLPDHAGAEHRISGAGYRRVAGAPAISSLCRGAGQQELVQGLR